MIRNLLWLSQRLGHGLSVCAVPFSQDYTCWFEKKWQTIQNITPTVYPEREGYVEPPTETRPTHDSCIDYTTRFTSCQRVKPFVQCYAFQLIFRTPGEPSFWRSRSALLNQGFFVYFQAADINTVRACLFPVLVIEPRRVSEEYSRGIRPRYDINCRGLPKHQISPISHTSVRAVICPIPWKHPRMLTLIAIFLGLLGKKISNMSNLHFEHTYMILHLNSDTTDLSCSAAYTHCQKFCVQLLPWYTKPRVCKKFLIRCPLRVQSVTNVLLYHSNERVVSNSSFGNRC